MIKKDLIVNNPYGHLTNKTNKIKDWYGEEFVKILAQEIRRNTEDFNFVLFNKNYKKHYKSLELKQRLKLIASEIDNCLDLSYKNKTKVFKKLMGPKWPNEEGMMNYGFHLYPISQYIEDYGAEDLLTSLKIIKELTQRFTGEFAIRSMLLKDPEMVLKTLKSWRDDKNFHVRRLSSEGLRSRLPWGQGVPWINKNLKKTIPFYTKLRNDPSLYVRRSVANAMGDLIKLDSSMALTTFDKWLKQKKNKENIWVIKHAIRNPVKKKNPEFLKLRKTLSLLEA